MYSRYKLSHITAILRQTVGTGVHVHKIPWLLVKRSLGTTSVNLKKLMLQVESKIN
jgi:hypothetical protein